MKEKLKIFHSKSQELKILSEQLDYSCSKDLLLAVEVTTEAVKNKKKVLILGNGGSATLANHLAGELVHKLGNKEAAIPAISLSSNEALLTSIPNDSSFDRVFERQIEALCDPGDVVVVVSTSDFDELNPHSRNIFMAITKAREKGATIIGLLSSNSQKARDLVDIALIVPSEDTQRVQEAHLFLGHLFCELVKDEFSKEE